MSTRQTPRTPAPAAPAVAATAGGTPGLAPPRTALVDLLQSKRVASAFAAVATQHLPPARMAQLCINAVRRTPDLARCEPVSVLGAMMFLASIGLEPNTPFGHAWLIPYERRRWNPQTRQRELVDVQCTCIIGYRGFVQLVYRTPQVIKFTGGAICQNDLFEYEEGSGSFLKHRIHLDRPRGPLIGAFAYVRMRASGGDAEFSCVLPLDEVHKRRSQSETWRHLAQEVAEAQTAADRRKAEHRLAQTPWVQWEADMAAKTAMRSMVKGLPLGGPLQVAAHVDEAADTGQARWAQFAEPDAARAIAEGQHSAELEDRSEAPEAGQLGDDGPEEPSRDGPSVNAPPERQPPAGEAPADGKPGRGPARSLPPLFGDEA